MARFIDDNGDPSAVMPCCVVSVDWRGHGRIAIETNGIGEYLFAESQITFASIESPTEDEKKAAVAAIVDEIDAALNHGSGCSAAPPRDVHMRHIPPPLIQTWCGMYGGYGDGSGQ
jgi:hypothetical protein